MSIQVKTAGLYASQPRQAGAWSWLQAALANRRSRNDLRSLEAHLLEDVGVSDADAQKEAKRPVWDVPGHWMR
jgi:uncharacterized protein YjiS (DUF1127 family)